MKTKVFRKKKEKKKNGLLSVVIYFINISGGSAENVR